MEEDNDDDYNYEYFEVDSPEKPIKSQIVEDDDQQAQKLNSQVEAYQDHIQRLEKELEKEKENHSITKSQLEQLQNEKLEVNALKAKINSMEKYDKDKPHSNTTLSRKMFDSFNNFCVLHEIENIPMEYNTFNEEKCQLVLKEVTKLINNNNKKLQQAAAPQPKKSSDDPSQRIADLEEELRLALGAAEDIRALKAKTIHLVEKIRSEKEDKLRAQGEVKASVKKLTMLSVHIEKLMIHLKHEAASKIKALDQLRESEKRNNNLTSKIAVLTRKTAAKDTYIAELREGSKILEDQLRLMDEKYLELRTKLDYAREVASKKVRIAQKNAAELRVKFALAGNKVPLDSIPLPNPYGEDQMSRSTSLPNVKAMNRSPPRSAAGKMKSHGHSKRGNSKSSSATGEFAGEKTVDYVIEKIKKLRGHKMEWTEEKLHALANTR
jgi:chromosome segregation ATPase